MGDQLRIFEKPRCYVNGLAKYGSATEEFLSRKSKSWEQKCKDMGLETERQFRKRKQAEREFKQRMEDKNGL